MQAREVWETAKGELALQMTKSMYDQHVRGVRVLEPTAEIGPGAQIVLEAGSEVSRQWLELRLLRVVGRAIGDVVGGVVSVRVVAAAGNGAGAADGQPHRAAPTEGVAASNGSAALAVEAECKKTVQVVDRRRGYSVVENVVVDQYLPLMGSTGFAVYALYCRLSLNREGCAWPSFRTVCAHLHIGPATLAEANQVLAVLGLLEVSKGDAHSPNRYYLLDAEDLDDAKRAAIRAAAAELAEGGTRRRILDGLDAGGPSWCGGSRVSASNEKRSASSQKRCASEPEAEQQQTCLLLDSETVVDGVDADNSPEAVADTEELLGDLVALGVERRTALNVLATSSLYRVCGWLDYTRAQQNLKNPAGFFLSRLGSGDDPP